MNIVFIGCVAFSHSSLEALLKLPAARVTGIVSKRKSPFNADFYSLEDLASKNDIPCFYAEEHTSAELAAFIRERKADVVYCFGWSSILPKEVLESARLGVIGSHPAALPQNRGRHPIVWALALGLEETASTFFFMDEGADSGDILDQRFVSIGPNDDAATLYAKLTALAIEQMTEFTPKLASGRYERRPQDHSKATYWRKRGKSDGLIDWRKPAKDVHNLVRALAKPYVGAHCELRGGEFKIWKTERVDFASSSAEPGQVLKTDGRRVVIKCGEGAVALLEHEIEPLPSEGDNLCEK